MLSKHTCIKPFVCIHLKQIAFFLSISFLLLYTFGCSSQKNEMIDPKEPIPSPNPNALFFETIEQSDNPKGIAKGYQGTSPSMVIVTKAEEVDDLGGLITPHIMSDIKAINFDQYLWLAVFQGKKPTNLYSITVETLTKVDHTIIVRAEAIEPDPEMKKGEVITSPYHLIRIKRGSSLSGKFTFKLLVNGNEVMIQEKEIPSTAP